MVNSRTGPTGTRLVNLNRALHTGDIGGLPAKFLVCVVSLSVLVQAYTGLAMWWKRTAPAKRRAQVPAEELVR
jgi:uncharacterized iron-regulated membrane protein